MGSKLVFASLLLALTLSGCSFFPHKAPAPLQIATPTPLPEPILVEQKTLPMSCDEHCSKQGGIKKTFCLKKCEHKKKKVERKALIEACAAKQGNWWSRLFQTKKHNSGIECYDL
ncbi:MAG: hypothetical protein QX191_04210 [Methylococcaceae bacterium]